MKLFKRILKRTANKYFLFTAFMIVWLCFIDKYNLIKRVEDQWQLHKMTQEADYYRSQIESVNTTRTLLFSNKETLEKFAREKYFMKKDGEEVFVVE